MYKLFVFILVWSFASANVIEHCSREAFTYALLDLMVPENKIPIWLCIAERQSGFNTYLVRNQPDGSRNFGAFGINSHGFCQDIDDETISDYCDVLCQDLLNDNLAESYECAVSIADFYGYDTWPSWHYCKDDLPNVSKYIYEYKLRNGIKPFGLIRVRIN